LPTTDSRVDVYLVEAAPFARPILERVRRAFHVGCPGVLETWKWSSPTFEYHGLLGNVTAYRTHVRITLFRAKELDDPRGLFTEDGERTTFTPRYEALADVPTQRVIAGYVRRAANLNSGPTRAPRPRVRRPAPRIPAELVAALAENDQARTFFEGLPPSVQRDYAEWISDAKRETTREKRLATSVQWLSEGKRRNWKHHPS
jgi:uncharacterized protein YdeI (YjbR/CyaY-like superfamily)